MHPKRAIYGCTSSPPSPLSPPGADPGFGEGRGKSSLAEAIDTALDASDDIVLVFVSKSI